MFICLDESLGKSYSVIGCICIPLNKVAEYEKILIQLRIDNKCWGELDWGSISDQYADKYKIILKKFLNLKDITFHSWAFKNPTSKDVKNYYKGDKEKPLYVQGYLLLRETLRKSSNAGFKNYYVLLDKRSGSLNEISISKQFLQLEGQVNPKPNIDFYKEIDSKVSGSMQIASICVSAVRYCYESYLNEASDRYNQIIEILKQTNGNLDINFSPRFPIKLFERKFHHCFFQPVK